MVAVSLWSCLLVAAACVSVSAHDVERAAEVAFGCGTQNKVVPTSASGALPRQTKKETIVRPRQAGNSSVLLPIDVVMQVISADETEEGGNISDETIDAQMQILNSAFEEVGYKFTLVETTRTINAHWYRDVKYYSPVETEIATTLHKGGIATLNVYTVGANNSTDYAWATTASEVQYRPEMDGVFINGTVLVGGSNPEKSEGKTLVHEVGHWFGLYHPFSYQCEFSFDYVDDTPHEMLDYSDPTSCEPRDSCPDHPGVDLIYNHMGYAKDSCRTSWTPGQIQRMREQVAKFRGVVYPGIDVNNIPEDSI